jgi:acyl-CoA synthetase (NDP forming)
MRTIRLPTGGRPLGSTTSPSGHRGAPVCDLLAVEDVLLRVARLADEVPQLAEMDLNQLMATPQGAVAVDVRIRH